MFIRKKALTDTGVASDQLLNVCKEGFFHLTSAIFGDTWKKKHLQKPCYCDSSQQMLHILTTMKNPNFKLLFHMFFITIVAVPMLLKMLQTEPPSSG